MLLEHLRVVLVNFSIFSALIRVSNAVCCTADESWKTRERARARLEIFVAKYVPDMCKGKLGKRRHRWLCSILILILADESVYKNRMFLHWRNMVDSPYNNINIFYALTFLALHRE